jgi:DNA-binding NarL/FixJ family response regulator
MTVLVADEHPVVREGVAMAVRRNVHLELVATAEGGVLAFDRIDALAPAVALVDRTMPDIDGMEVLRMVVQAQLATHVVLFAEAAEGEDVHEAVVCGAAGYVDKHEELRAISEAICRVGRGERYLSPQAQAVLFERLTMRSPSVAKLLSERELEILQRTADGVSSAQIGRQLHLSQSTVKNHQQHIYEKLGVSKAPAAVLEAVRLGLLR